MTDDPRGVPLKSAPYFHGGKRGLSVGGYILPPSTTKVLSASDFVAMGGAHRRDRVYVTTDLVAAQLYAVSNSGAGQKPTVYEVAPEGDLEPDRTAAMPNVPTHAKRPRSSRFTMCPVS